MLRFLPRAFMISSPGRFLASLHIDKPFSTSTDHAINIISSIIVAGDAGWVGLGTTRADHGGRVKMPNVHSDFCVVSTRVRKIFEVPSLTKYFNFHCIKFATVCQFVTVRMV